MRWKKRDKEIPEIGDKRLVERFLFLPQRLDKEWRWLEMAQIEQEFQRAARWWGLDWDWVDTHWATLDEPLEA